MGRYRGGRGGRGGVAWWRQGHGAYCGQDRAWAITSSRNGKTCLPPEPHVQRYPRRGVLAQPQHPARGHATRRPRSLPAGTHSTQQLLHPVLAPTTTVFAHLPTIHLLFVSPAHAHRSAPAPSTDSRRVSGPDKQCVAGACFACLILQGAWPLGKAYMDDAVTEFFDATLKHLHEPHGASGQLGAGAGGAAGAAAAAGAGAAATAAGWQRSGTVGAPVAVSDAARAAATAGAAAAAARSCASASSCCSNAAWRSPGAATAEGAAGNDAASRAKAAAAAAAEAAKRAEAEAAVVARKVEVAERAAAQVRLLMHLQVQQEQQRVLQALAAAEVVDAEDAAKSGKAGAQNGRIRSRL